LVGSALNGGIVRSSQYHCDNNEVVELSVLRHKELEAPATSGSTVLTLEPAIHRSVP
jgi:hypothetical protein